MTAEGTVLGLTLPRGCYDCRPTDVYELHKIWT